MEKIDLKGSMKSLWKRTFGDSSDYIDLVFNSYWDDKYVAASVGDDGLRASLLGVPYDFGNDLRGLYLCGLATDPRFRRKGIMSALIEEINNKARTLGFDFTFLIPANNGLFKYYEDRGYVAGAYRLKERYVANHDFDNVFLNSASETDKDLYEKLRVKKLNFNDGNFERIYRYIFNNENNLKFVLRHSLEDIANIIKENIISGGIAVFAEDDKGIVKGIAFAEVGSDSIFVPHLYYDEGLVRIKLLSHVAAFFQVYPLEVCYYPKSVSTQKQLWSPYNPESGLGIVDDSETFFPEIHESHPYGMFRLLNRSHVEQVMISNDLMRPDAGNGVTDADFARVIWRNPLSSSVISDAFQIKPLPTSISLLLD